jgi:hypothetical protein
MLDGNITFYAGKERKNALLSLKLGLRDLLHGWLGIRLTGARARSDRSIRHFDPKQLSAP